MSHAQNQYTIAASQAQTAIGKYNVSDSADTYAFIIGNGTADNARSNALTIDWNGNISGYHRDYAPGETATITSNVPGYGYVPGSPNGRAYLYLDTLRRFPTDKAITINSLTLTIRGPGGLILNGVDATAYSPTADVMGNGQIRFYLTGLPTTNMSLNTPLVCFGTFSVSIAS